MTLALTHPPWSEAGLTYTEGQQNGPRLVTEGLTHHFVQTEGGLA